VNFAERILGDPRLYDRVQTTFGLNRLRARVAPVLAALEPGTLLDVGAGTANFYPVVPATLEYVALDVDPRKLDGLRTKHPDVRTILASGTTMPLEDDAVDHALCVDVSHHLADDELDAFFAEIARVTRRTLVFVDALRKPRLASRLLWLLDRGSHPRPLPPLREAIERSFEVVRLEEFTIQHAYVLVVASPRTRA
jgi:ubiquinone/menaquinone biosynthesis C-methylase UbiE